MESPKLLVTAGCSFSQVPPVNRNWPDILQRELNCEGLHLGQGAAGNSFITRKTLYHLNKKLKKIDGKDIILGIMWSGYDRQNFYFNKIDMSYSEIFYGNGNHNIMNPAALDIYHTERKNYITNFVWTDDLSTVFYKNLYDSFACVLDTLENILTIQLFCERYNIRYFFTNYNTDTIPISLDECKSGYPQSYKEAEYFYDLIDWSKWLPVRHAWKWMLEESGYPEDISLGNHPTGEQSKAFVDRVIIPHIKKLSYV